MMSRGRVVAIGSVAVVLIGALAGGVWWHQYQSDRQAAELAAERQAEDEIEASAGLSVSAGATNLGQLGDNQGQSNNKTSNTSSESSNGNLNPAQFAQYDKYRNEQSALFGDIQAGNGAELTAGRKAGIYYKVWLTNGALVDQSPVSASGQRQPFSFALGGRQVIAGLEQGVLGMKAGGKRLVIVPPAAGYGAQGQGAIPPNSVLVFEVQLVNVQ
jgi:FKBP-type peptidyl-prolyl cis-trans isomerase FkpA